jgi:hypothetical protein
VVNGTHLARLAVGVQDGRIAAQGKRPELVSLSYRFCRYSVEANAGEEPAIEQKTIKIA